MSSDRPRVTISKEDLHKHYERELQFLEKRVNAFDEGDYDEAPNIALILRILLYDKRQSKSLLSQLGLKNQRFFDSAINYDPHELLPQKALIATVCGKSSKHYIALLDDTPKPYKKIEFEKWWNELIFLLGNNQLSRGQIICIAANQDGGAHVDGELDEAYFNISKDGLSGKSNNDPQENSIYIAIRQIAHEVLKTLIPNYSKMPKPVDGTIIYHESCIQVQPNSINPFVQAQKKIGRNEPCPCGSGIKYKKCHGKEF